MRQILSAPRAFHCRDPLPNDSDERLLQRYRAGDVDAFEALVDRHRPGVFRFLARQVGDRARAEELAQDAFLRLVQAAARWEPRASPRTWLYQVARNLAVDEARRAVHRRSEPLDAPVAAALAAEGRAPDGAAEDAMVRPRIEAAIAALPAEQREVFLLREYEDVPFAEIAAITGAPVPTVKSRMRYALEALRRALSDLAAGDAGQRSATP
jgi:RNA polymerase sigma-70 factor (ECF subfamily)